MQPATASTAMTSLMRPSPDL